MGRAAARRRAAAFVTVKWRTSVKSSHLTAQSRSDRKRVCDAFWDIDWSGVLITNGGL